MSTGATLRISEMFDVEELRKRLHGDDPRQAASAILGAARQGAPLACTLLGQILLEGRGIEKDPALARTWFQIAAERGDAMGRNMLGRCLEHGWGGPADVQAAAEHYRQAMDSGLDWATYNYAGLLATGRGVAQDQHQAFALYRRAAEAGHAKSMNLVGRYYEEGIATPADARTALDWYKRSAQAGDFRGQFSYAAVLMAQGDVEVAKGWLEKALSTGNLNFLRTSRSSLAQATPPQLAELTLAFHQRAAQIGDDSDQAALEAFANRR